MNAASPASCPAARGFVMPAEWERHSATWLAWPYNPQTWEGHLEGAEEAFAVICRMLAPHEQVQMLVPNESIGAMVRRKLADLPPGALQLHVVESGDVWIRDYGPIFVTCPARKEIGFSKWRYNAYGNKYEDLLVGDAVVDKLDLPGCERFDTGLVLEGGSIDVNGRGTLITTESCLLSPDRNPHLGRADIEEALRCYLGAVNVLGLNSGIAGDDTTGHVDDIARFVDPATVVACVEEDPADENYEPLRENFERLQAMQDEQGRPLTVIPLPMPREFIVDGRRMAASYANFYIANEVVLVPTYGQPACDQSALQILARCFPTRRVVGIDCRELIWGYGSIHCATQQQPAL